MISILSFIYTKCSDLGAGKGALMGSGLVPGFLWHALECAAGDVRCASRLAFERVAPHYMCE